MHGMRVLSPMICRNCGKHDLSFEAKLAEKEADILRLSALLEEAKNTSNSWLHSYQNLSHFANDLMNMKRLYHFLDKNMVGWQSEYRKEFPLEWATFCPPPGYKAKED